MDIRVWIFLYGFGHGYLGMDIQHGYKGMIKRA